jgi:hypothetical protein
VNRTNAQNRKFNAMLDDVVRAYPLPPWKKTLAREAWKRFFIQTYVREARLEAYANGGPDPFPVRPVPSRQLTAGQADELIEFVMAYCALHLGLELE